MPRSTRFANVRFSVSGSYGVRPALVGASLSVLFLACGGAAVAPQELLDARTAYAEAAKGPAADLAPAQLDTAKVSLDGAEQSFKEEGAEQVTKDLAYIAQRRAELAAAEGGREKAERKRAAADKDFKTAQIEGLQKTKEQLNAEKAARVDAEKKAAAAMSSLAEIAKVKEESRGVVITLSGSVLFATNQSSLLAIAKDKLDQVASALQGQGFKAIVVQGYTDSRGNASDNERLSLKRAQSVRDHLVSRGLPSDKVTAEGLGASKPVADNGTADGRAENRRVEIVVTPDK
ncbi:MAG TPA: OmpA family protein [Polyangiaceae bacterium]|nr:OmpA family protein [Polyangiaceae bacterium]